MHFTGQFLHFAYKEWNFLINMKYHQGSERIDIDLLVGERMVISMKIIVHDLGIHTEYFNKQDYKTIGDFIYESLVTLKNAGAEIAAVTANTEHIAWGYVKDRLPLPTISIVEYSGYF